MNYIAQYLPLPPSELSAFLAVAEHGGFRAAAKASGLSPSAISHAVAGLEARLKIQLFLRTTRSVALTETGERFAEAVRPAIAQLAEALQGIGSSKEPAGTLRINASRTAAAQVLEPLLLGFLRCYPQMRIDVATGRGSLRPGRGRLRLWPAAPGAGAARHGSSPRWKRLASRRCRCALLSRESAATDLALGSRQPRMHPAASCWSRIVPLGVQPPWRGIRGLHQGAAGSGLGPISSPPQSGLVSG